MNIALNWPRRLARLYTEDIRKSESLHAGHIMPGATTWVEAIDRLFDSFDALSPRKIVVRVQQVVDYLNSIPPEQRSHLLIADDCKGRTTRFVLLTFSYGPHPDPCAKDAHGRPEQGLNLELHMILCSRSNKTGGAGIPTAFVCQHAIERLYERGHDVTDHLAASGVFGFVGVLGYLAAYRKKHVGGELSMVFSDLLVTGPVHRFPRLTPRGEPYQHAMIDIRTVIDTNTIGDGSWRQRQLAQGHRATEVVMEWFNGSEEPKLGNKIPFVPSNRDSFAVQKRVQQV